MGPFAKQKGIFKSIPEKGLSKTEHVRRAKIMALDFFRNTEEVEQAM